MGRDAVLRWSGSHSLLSLAPRLVEGSPQIPSPVRARGSQTPHSSTVPPTAAYHCTTIFLPSAYHPRCLLACLPQRPVHWRADCGRLLGRAPQLVEGSLKNPTPTRSHASQTPHSSAVPPTTAYHRPTIPGAFLRASLRRPSTGEPTVVAFSEGRRNSWKVA